MRTNSTISCHTDSELRSLELSFTISADFYDPSTTGTPSLRPSRLRFVTVQLNTASLWLLHQTRTVNSRRNNSIRPRSRALPERLNFQLAQIKLDTPPLRTDMSNEPETFTASILEDADDVWLNSMTSWYTASMAQLLAERDETTLAADVPWQTATQLSSRPSTAFRCQQYLHHQLLQDTSNIATLQREATTHHTTFQTGTQHDPSATEGWDFWRAW